MTIFFDIFKASFPFQAEEEVEVDSTAAMDMAVVVEAMEQVVMEVSSADTVVAMEAAMVAVTAAAMVGAMEEEEVAGEATVDDIHLTKLNRYRTG